MRKLILNIVIFAGTYTLASTASAFTFGDLGPRFDFSFGDGGGMPDDVPNFTGQQMSPNAVKLYGSMGPIDGARFRNNFVLYWSGYIDGPISPGENYAADITFDAHATGGSLEWKFFTDLFCNENTQHEYISTGLMPVPPSGQVVGAHFESPPFSEPGQTGYFSGYLHINWTGYSPTDTFSINIPQNSIDVTYLAVPEPNLMLALAASLFAGMLSRLSRRHR